MTKPACIACIVYSQALRCPGRQAEARGRHCALPVPLRGCPLAGQTPPRPWPHRSPMVGRSVSSPPFQPPSLSAGRHFCALSYLLFDEGLSVVHWVPVALRLKPGHGAPISSALPPWGPPSRLPSPHEWAWMAKRWTVHLMTKGICTRRLVSKMKRHENEANSQALRQCLATHRIRAARRGKGRGWGAGPTPWDSGAQRQEAEQPDGHTHRRGHRQQESR